MESTEYRQRNLFGEFAQKDDSFGVHSGNLRIELHNATNGCRGKPQTRRHRLRLTHKEKKEGKEEGKRRRKAATIEY